MSLRKDFETDVKEFQTIQNQTALWYLASFFLVLIYLLPQDTMVNQNNLRVQYCKISPQNSYKFCVSQDNFFIVLFLALFNEFLCLWQNHKIFFIRVHEGNFACKSYFSFEKVAFTLYVMNTQFFEAYRSSLFYAYLSHKSRKSCGAILCISSFFLTSFLHS